MIAVFVVGVLATVLGGYLLVLLVAYLIQGRLVFPAPRAHPFPRPAWEHARIDLTHDGIVFRGHLIETPDAPRRGLVFYCGGNGEEVSWNCDTFAHLGVSHIALFNYRGYAGTAGMPGERALIADTRALLAQVQRRTGHDDTRTVLMGRSIGSAVAVCASEGRSLAGLLLITPLASVLRLARRGFPLLPVRLLLRHRFDALAVARRSEVPVEMIVAGADEVTPPEEAALLAAAWAGPCRSHTLAGIAHNNVHEHPDYLPAVTGALRRMLP